MRVISLNHNVKAESPKAFTGTSRSSVKTPTIRWIEGAEGSDTIYVLVVMWISARFLASFLRVNLKGGRDLILGILAFTLYYHSGIPLGKACGCMAKGRMYECMVYDAQGGCPHSLLLYLSVLEPRYITKFIQQVDIIRLIFTVRPKYNTYLLI